MTYCQPRLVISLMWTITQNSSLFPLGSCLHLLRMFTWGGNMRIFEKRFILFTRYSTFGFQFQFSFDGFPKRVTHKALIFFLVSINEDMSNLIFVVFTFYSINVFVANGPIFQEQRWFLTIFLHSSYGCDALIFKGLFLSI